MNRTATATIFIALSPGVAFAGAAGEAPQAVLPADEARMSVEIPLEGPLRVAGAKLLRVNELLVERTEFHPDDFRLDELVLVARSEADTAGEAELLIMDWRSGEFDIPPAGEDEWYEVRIPAPKEEPSAGELVGAWLLDLVGDVTVDMLVAVLEPLPEAAALHSPTRTRTVYRVVDDRPAKVTTRWVHSPYYYHVYHYHHGWPYRYFWGPWHYELVYRPHHRHYRHHGHRQVRHKHRDSRRHHRKLRRIHPRARVFVPERRAERPRHTHRADRGTHRAERRERHSNAPGRARANRHLRTGRTERHREAATPRPRVAAERASASTRPARGTVARPLPRRRDYVRASTPPTRPSAQPRSAPRATPTQPRAQAPRRAPPRATARPARRQGDFARESAAHPAVAPQRATPNLAPARRDVARSRSFRPVRTRAAADVRPRARTAQPRPQPPAPARRTPPPARAKAEPRQADAPRSHRPSRGDRPERHLR